MTALLECRLHFPFETNLLQTLYLNLSEIEITFRFLSLLYLVIAVSHVIAPLPQRRIYRVLTANITMPELALECFKIMTALLKCLLDFSFDTDLFQTLYLMLSEISLWCLSLLYLIVGASCLTAPSPQ